MSAKDHVIQLPLSTLITFLEGEGFRVGVDQRLKLQKVLLTFGKGATPEDLEALKTYLGPVVVKSQNQQALFDYAFRKYVQYIQSNTKAFEDRIEGKVDEKGELEKGEDRKKRYTLLITTLLTVAFLVLAYFMNRTRVPPQPDFLELPPEIVSVGDTLVIEGLVNGILAGGEILIDDTSIESDWFISPGNNSIRAEYVFDTAKTHEITVRARNLLTPNSIAQTTEIAVCESKPQIDFDYEIEPLNPQVVSFLPKIVVDTTRPYSLQLKANGERIPRDQMRIYSDTLIVHEFEVDNDGLFDIELAVLYDTLPHDDICDISISRKTISLNSVILGEERPLLAADPSVNPDSIFTTSRLRVGVIEYKGGRGLSETYTPIFNSLVARIDQYNGLEPNFDIEPDSLSQQLLSGDIDIGVYTVFPYLNATRKHPQLAVVATHTVNDQRSFKGHIVARKDSRIDDLGDFDEKRFLFVKETSTSGYKLPVGLFEVRGYKILEMLEAHDFSGSHDASIQQLIAGQTDGIAVDEHSWKRADTSNLKIIETYSVPYHAYVLSPALAGEQRQRIQTLLTDSISIESANPLGITEIIPINDASYNDHRRYLKLPRRKPALLLDSILIDEGLDSLRLKDDRKIIQDSIQALIALTNRFAPKDSTQFIHRSQLVIEEDEDDIARFTIFLDDEFIGTGQAPIEELASQLPEVFINSILHAFPVKTKLKRNSEGNRFIPYGTNDGIDASEYVFVAKGDTIPYPTIDQSNKLDSYFTSLDSNKYTESDFVEVSYPSSGVNTTLYFNLFDKRSWKRMSLGEIIGLIAALLILSALVPLLWEIFYFRKRKTIPSKDILSSLDFEGIEPPYDLELPNQNSRIKPEKELYELSRRLKHRREAGTTKLDISGSIKKTANSAGYIDLDFKETTRIPEYLVLVDRSQAEGFQLELFNYLQEFLKNEDTFVEVYYFNRNPKYLKNKEHPKGITLDAVSEKYPYHTLIIISDGKWMLNAKLDRVFRWAATLLSRWNKRFLLTPRRFSDWGRNEEIIDGYIPVLPATLKGFIYMSESLLNDELPGLNARISQLKLEKKRLFPVFMRLKEFKRH